MRLYSYVGPAVIRDRPRGEPGARIHGMADLVVWLGRHPEAMHAPVTFVVDADGALRLAPRRSEHIDCAGGGPVRAAGEVRFAPSLGGPVIAEVTNQSTGYCPDPDCWPAVRLGRPARNSTQALGDAFCRIYPRLLKDYPVHAQQDFYSAIVR